jgi:hypothetical protein
VSTCNYIPPRRIQSLFAAALVLLLGRQAMAGHYATVTYTASGSFAMTNGAPPSQSFAATSGSQLFAGMWYIPYPGGSFAANNPSITATAVWVPDFANEPAPKAIVCVTSSVNFTSDATLMGPGTVANGLGASQSAGSTGWVSLGATSQALTAEAGTSSITRTITPSMAVGLVQFAGASAHIQATINFSMQVWPITLDLKGTSDDNGVQKLVVGRFLTGTVNTHGFPTNSGDTYTWLSPSGGSPFADYQPSASSATLTPFTLPANQSPSLSCYFRQPDSVTLQCTYHSGALNQDFALTAALTTVGPSRAQIHSECGLNKLLNGYAPPNTPAFSEWQTGDSTPTSFSLWGAEYSNTVWGMFQVDTLLDPPFVLAGSGQWSYVQTRGGYIIMDGLRSNFSGLDGGGPAGSVPWTPADGLTPQIFMDMPGLSATYPDSFSCPISFLEVATFNLYIFYKPSDGLGGKPSVYIPVVLRPWFALGHCSSIDGTTWSQGDNGSCFTATVSYPPFPTW